jgi:hypothetical protein
LIFGEYWGIFDDFCRFLGRNSGDLGWFWGKCLRMFWWCLMIFWWRLVNFDDFVGFQSCFGVLFFFTIKLRVFFAGQDSGSWPSTLISPEMGLELQKGLELELIPFGKHLHNDEKSPCYSWENPL